MSKLVYRLPPDLTKVDLKALVLAVKEIQNLLSPPPTKEELEEALDAAGELNALDYTQQSWQELATAVLEGNQVLEAVDATQEQIDDATQDINKAIDNLVEWTPAEEFSSGERGVWFDPSDLTTLYQDSSGQTPVTGNGQPVGLMLDKSKGLELGPELSTEYDSGDWYLTGSPPNQWQIDSANVISVDNTGGTTSCYLRSDDIGMVEGKTYRIEFEILTSNGIGGFRLTNGTDNGSPVFLSTGPVSIIFKAGGVNVGTFGPQAYPNWVGSIGNISVKELPGHHASQPTTAAKPTYTRVGDTFGLEHDDVDDVIPFSVPNYTGRISAAGSFRGSPSGVSRNTLRAGGANGPFVMVGELGNTGVIVNGRAGGGGVVTRVDGQLFTGNRDDLHYRWTSPAKDIQVTSENIDPTDMVWADQAQTLVYSTFRPGGILYAYIEVEKPAFDDLPRLEHWLAKKAGVTL